MRVEEWNCHSAVDETQLNSTEKGERINLTARVRAADLVLFCRSVSSDVGLRNVSEVRFVIKVDFSRQRGIFFF